MAERPPLIIPVENQVRELDPKLLLACVAARRGFPSIIGDLREIDLRLTAFPRGIYLCKSMTARNINVFEILRKLGHRIVTWDEEALVHLPADIYYSRRLSPVAIRYLAHLFAWGEDNADLWRRYPDIPPDMPIHVTGNPRNDLLRPELCAFYADDVRSIREAYGDFILVNTNFNHVNAFYPAQNLFAPVKPGEEPRFGKAGVGMTPEYAEGLRDHKQAIFEAFQRLIPALEAAFPDHRIVVRPHPTEGQDVYREIAARGSRIHVTNEGNVVAWLLATRALVHNGCTTGVEAHVLRVPAVSFRARVDDRYDRGFYRLPNLVSHECYGPEEVQETLRRILRGEVGPADGDERRELVARHLAALDGPLACERIVDVLEAMAEGGEAPGGPSAAARCGGLLHAYGRRALKRVLPHLPGFRQRKSFYRHRYPGVTLAELQRRLDRFRELLSQEGPVRARELPGGLFRIAG